MIENVGSYHDSLSFGNKFARLLWRIGCLIFFNPFPGPLFRYWRNFFLRLWGAKIGRKCAIASTVRIWAPWNLELGDYVSLGPNVEVYDVSKIVLGSHVTISQDAYLCTASHDVSLLLKPLIHEPIYIADFSWVCARAIVLPGVNLGHGAVVAAGAVVTQDVKPWTIVGGNPACFIKKREIKESLL